MIGLIVKSIAIIIVEQLGINWILNFKKYAISEVLHQ